MKYLSTRGDATPRAFCEILLEGLAPDGGLYRRRPIRRSMRPLARWRAPTPAAFEILSCTDRPIPAADLRALVSAYTAQVLAARRSRR